MEEWQAVLKEEQFNGLLLEWNKKINLVSRKKSNVFDLIEDSKLFFPVIDFNRGIQILDLGTGGGFPGIVIAIHYPQVNLTLIDSIQKKINVVKDIVKKLGLVNVSVICSRAEELGKNSEYKNKFDYIVSRSVGVLQDLCKWSKDLIKQSGKLITVKGGSVDGELRAAKRLKYVKIIDFAKAAEKKVIIISF
jgi:16S rRNA (guanine527-N7)-methyltransferase